MEGIVRFSFDGEFSYVGKKKEYPTKEEFVKAVSEEDPKGEYKVEDVEECDVDYRLNSSEDGEDCFIAYRDGRRHRGSFPCWYIEEDMG